MPEQQPHVVELLAADNDDGSGLLAAADQFDEVIEPEEPALGEDKETEEQQQEGNLFD